jgi:hypothetical protein
MPSLLISLTSKPVLSLMNIINQIKLAVGNPGKNELDFFAICKQLFVQVIKEANVFRIKQHVVLK